MEIKKEIAVAVEILVILYGIVEIKV